MELINTMDTEQKITDMTFLTSFSGGDTVRMKKYVGMFLQIAPQQLEKIRTALTASDWDAVRANAHSLKPQITYMGIKEGEALIKQIENDAASRTAVENIPSMFSQLEELCAKAIVELDVFMKQ
jgi:HPt (histidine-containing phosphotransfer) domain-containing protein